ncbi:zinc-binding oxidoreductase CipB [Xylariales sp. PMI_506]|nr:zinc-binding oxidoreductase CipB [Xylariales sp. PMI_506]
MLPRAVQYILGLTQVATPPQNLGAWIKAPKSWPLVVREAPYPTPLPHEIIVQSRAVAVNPVDWKIQYQSIFDLDYPLILGEDVAGEVVEVGSAVGSAFQVGDRVTAYASGRPASFSRRGAFQQYVAVPVNVSSHIPDTLSFTDAAVLPLGIATAAAGLFQDDYLNLPLPIAKPANQLTTDSSATNSAATDKVLLIWGGSSSVGTSAIQLAAAAGVHIATTASPHNHEYVKSLGAEWAFDYRSDSVVQDIISALKGLDFVGVYDATAGNATQEASVQIVNGLSESGKGIKVVTVDGGKNVVRNGVRIQGISSSTITGNAVGSAVFNDFLPTALKTGQILAKPDAWVIAHGLGGIQKGVDASKAGVSAQKIVITL